jgi:hypothetical protein
MTTIPMPIHYAIATNPVDTVGVGLQEQVLANVQADLDAAALASPAQNHLMKFAQQAGRGYD